MIIANGTLEVKVKTGGGIDPDTRFPVRAEETWGDPVPCQIASVTRDNLGVTSEGEAYAPTSYTVLVETLGFRAERVRLRDVTGADMGEFPVRCAETLEAVCQTRLTL